MRSLLAALLLVAIAAPASAGEAERRTMERLFLQGRLNELEDAADTADVWCQFLLAVRDRYWQRSGPPHPRVDDGGDALLTKRLQWLQGQGAYTLSKDDPIPIVSALIHDREIRESTRPDPTRAHGLALQALRLTGPEGTALDEGLYALGVHRTFEPSPEDVKSVARADDLASRNAWIGILTVLILLLGVWIGGRALGARQA